MNNEAARPPALNPHTSAGVPARNWGPALNMSTTPREARGRIRWRVGRVARCLAGVAAGCALVAPGTASAAPARKLDPALARLASHSPRERVSVIVQFRAAIAQTRARAIVRSVGGRNAVALPIIHGLALRLPARAAVRLAMRRQVRAVSLNGVVQAQDSGLDPKDLQSVFNRSVGTEGIWRQATGQGVGVAVIDSGVDGNLPDFQSSQTDTSSRVIASVVTNPYASSADDPYGHGTMVAGLIAGNGADRLSGDPFHGQYAGAAPEANIISIKAGDDQGNASVLDVIYGIQFAIDHRTEYNIRVLNLSLESDTAQSYLTDPLDAAVEAAWFDGIAVVVAAGNRGSYAGAVDYAPANDPYVITVGAVDDPATDQQRLHQLQQADRQAEQAKQQSDKQAEQAKAQADQAALQAKQQADQQAEQAQQQADQQTEQAISDPAALQTQKLADQQAEQALQQSDNQAEQALAQANQAAEQALAQADQQAEQALQQADQQAEQAEQSVDQGIIAGWSSRGITQDGFAKPDIYAPGAHIVSLLAPDSAFASMCSSCTIGGAYIRAGGTSLAAPIVAGAVADILQVNPDWTPDMVKGALVNTGHPLPGNVGIEFNAGPALHAGPDKLGSDSGLTPSTLLSTAPDGSVDLTAAGWTRSSWSVAPSSLTASWARSSWSCTCSETPSGSVDPTRSSWSRSSWSISGAY